MSWWGWLIVGIVLVGAELMTDAAFYLVFAGAAAIVVGLLVVAGLGLPVWAQWVAFSVLAIASMVLFRRKLYDRLRGGGSPGMQHAAVDALVTVDEDVAPGRRTRVRLQGTQWDRRERRVGVDCGRRRGPRGRGGRRGAAHRGPAAGTGRLVIR